MLSLIIPCSTIQQSHIEQWNDLSGLTIPQVLHTFAVVLLREIDWEVLADLLRRGNIPGSEHEVQKKVISENNIESIESTVLITLSTLLSKKIELRN